MSDKEHLPATSSGQSPLPGTVASFQAGPLPNMPRKESFLQRKPDLPGGPSPRRLQHTKGLSETKSSVASMHSSHGAGAWGLGVKGGQGCGVPLGSENVLQLWNLLKAIELCILSG